jgi:hypothetical protein
MQWEYNIVERELDKYQLNDLGKEGWELVGFNKLAEPSKDGTHVFVFKRSLGSKVKTKKIDHLDEVVVLNSPAVTDEVRAAMLKAPDSDL